MDVQVSVAGPDSTGETVALAKWLRGHRELQGRVRAIPRPPTDSELGGALDVLSVALGSGGAVAALAHSLAVWLTSRKADVKLIVKRDGRSVELSALRVADAEALIKQILEADDGS